MEAKESHDKVITYPKDQNEIKKIIKFSFFENIY
jgi:hypothetical protein